MILQFGAVENPLGSDRGVDSGAGGLIGLGSGVIRLIIIGAGIMSLFNFIFAGIQYINSQGDPKAIEAAQQKIVVSVIGLIIIAASFILTAVMGILIFGDAGAFLQPVLYGPND